MRVIRFALAALFFATTAHASLLSDALARYRTAMETGEAALKANDLATAKHAFETARDLEPQIPQPYLKLALVATRSGDKANAIALLDTYAGMHKLLDLDTGFAVLKGTTGYTALAARFKQNATPICRCETFWTGILRDFFIAEGIAKDGPRLFVASVRARGIDVIAERPDSLNESNFVALPGKLAPFGILADHARNRLLVAAAELHPDGGPPDENALLSYDLNTRALIQRVDGPKAAQLGDLALAPDGTIYLSDSRGPLFRLAPNGMTLEELSHDFISPQGMVVSPDGQTVLVADYSAGLQLLDIATRKLTAVEVPRGLTTVTMDGLAQLADGTFVATQNNIAPVRIVQFALSKDWSRVLWMKMLAVNAPEASDPSLITTDGNKIYAVGVAQWGSLADNATDLKPPLHRWQILELTP